MTPEQDQRRQATLARHFIALADTLVADFDVVEVMHELMNTCLELLDVDEAGLMLTDTGGRLQRIASSSESARLLELLQVQSREGPCVEAVQRGEVVVVDDIEQHRLRWPTFAERLVEDGFRSVYAFPLRLREASVGGLNLFGAEAGALRAEDRVVAQSLAAVATIGILQQRSVSRATVLAENLQRALDSRIVIEQAKGVLSERGHLPMEHAFALMRHYARSHQLRLGDVAHSIVHPPHVADAVLAHPID